MTGANKQLKDFTVSVVDMGDSITGFWLKLCRLCCQGMGDPTDPPKIALSKRKIHKKFKTY